MCKLLKKDEEFICTKACSKSWEWMKASMTCLFVLIVLDWKLEFHVHIDASNFALGAMLSQTLDKTTDKPIYYVSRLMNNVKKNCTTTKKKGLAMIYAVKKFRHYLLGNSFIFFMDHRALLYLVNKPIVISQIAKWLLLLQEFNFKVIFKLRHVHFLLDQLSKINHGDLAIRVEDQLSNAQLFGIKIDWYGQIIDYL
jgi:hypothetical protein